MATVVLSVPVSLPVFLLMKISQMFLIVISAKYIMRLFIKFSGVSVSFYLSSWGYFMFRHFQSFPAVFIVLFNEYFNNV